MDSVPNTGDLTVTWPRAGLWLELLLANALCATIAAAVATLLRIYILRARGSASKDKPYPALLNVLVFACIALTLLPVPQFVPCGVVTKLMISTLFFLCTYKCGEVLAGTIPSPVILEDPKFWFVYLCSPIECADYVSSKPARATATSAATSASQDQGDAPPASGPMSWRGVVSSLVEGQSLLCCVRRGAAKLAAEAVLIAVLAHHDYRPSSHPVVNYYCDTWAVYLFLSSIMDLLSAALTLFGFKPMEIFRSPLTASRGPRDFWSNRWNLLVKGLFQRTIFAPLRRRIAAVRTPPPPAAPASPPPTHEAGGGGGGAKLLRPKQAVPVAVSFVASDQNGAENKGFAGWQALELVCGVLAGMGAFFVSGLFHEYIMWACAGSTAMYRTRLMGHMMRFFLIQGLYTAGDVVTQKAVAAAGLDRMCTAIPTGGYVIGTTCMLVPYAHYFIDPVREAGLFGDMAAMLPIVSVAAP